MNRLTKSITRKLITAMLLSLLLFTVFSACSIWTYAAENDTVHADAAIVLGTKVIDGEPSPALKERIRHAVSLYKEGFVDKLIFTGGKTDGSDVAESEASRDFALQLDVPVEAILFETKSMVTEENFLYANEVAEEYGMDNFLVVSDPLHMKRALLMAGAAGIEAHSSPTRTTIFNDIKSKLPFFARETVCYVGYVLAEAIKF